jgi:preprotein translocase subunit SecB
MFDKVSLDLSNHKSDELSLSFETTGNFIKDESVYELSFRVNVFNENQDEFPFVTVRCVGLFKFDNVSELNEIPDFFYRNAIAILFPYVRAYISLITSQANLPGIILPTLNLSHLEVDLRKNTIQKK